MSDNNKSTRNNYDYLDIREEISEKIDTIREFAHLEGTEMGEAAHLVTQMWRYCPDYLSEQMYKSVVDEIDRLVYTIENEYELIVEEEEETVKRQTKYYEYRG